MIETCLVCGGTDKAEVFTLRNVPVICNQLWEDEESARGAPLGDVELVVCENCALIWNRAFDRERMSYAPGYENALHYSPRFQAFATELVRDLVARHALAGRDVVEIGCGDGYMLDLMVRHGARNATGFDPSMAGNTTAHCAHVGVKIVPEYFRPDQLHCPFDFILCRHVLEHVDQPLQLLTDIRRAIGDCNVPVYFETPNAGWMLNSVSAWDIIYEHVTYWTASSITTLFRRAGLEPTDLRTGYGGQFLMLEGRPTIHVADCAGPKTDEVRAAAFAFAKAANAELAKWRGRFESLDGKAVVWGAGSKGITFANAVGDTHGRLAALVDLNPRKHGLFSPGAALPVVPPDALRDLDPELLLISNALYATEIGDQVREMGLACEIDVIIG